MRKAETIRQLEQTLADLERLRRKPRKFQPRKSGTSNKSRRADSGRREARWRRVNQDRSIRVLNISARIDLLKEG